ncbi:MAG: choice-of-anchor D domain-containing protein [Myxococcota bacterium]|jgi:hypothetical protein
MFRPGRSEVAACVTTALLAILALTGLALTSCTSSPVIDSDGGPDGSICAKPCTTSAQCGSADLKCKKNCCTANVCTYDIECPDGEKCTGNRCVPVGPGDGGDDATTDGGTGPIPCEDQSKCPADMWCNPSTHYCEDSPVISTDFNDTNNPMNFGPVAWGDEKSLTLKITNVGKLPLSLNGFAFDKMANPDPKNPFFSIVSGGSVGGLNPGEKRDVVVKFKQLDASQHLGNLSISHNDNIHGGLTLVKVMNDVKGTPHFKLLDRSKDPAELLYPKPGADYTFTLDLGYVKQGETAHRVITVINDPPDGNPIMKLVSMISEQTTIGVFTTKFMTTTSPSQEVLAPFFLDTAEMMDLVIDYKTDTKVLEETKTWEITTNDAIQPPDKPATPKLTFSVNVKSEKPKMEVIWPYPPNPPVEALPFGEVNQFSTNTFTIRIKNSGGSELTILTGTEIEAPLNGFSLPGFPNLPFKLMPDQYNDVAVQFLPTVLGVATANLKIFSDDPLAPLLTIPLSGTAIKPVIHVTPSPIAFGQVIKNTPPNPKITVSVSNTGVGTLNVSNLKLTTVDAYFYLENVPNVPFPIAPGITKTFDVRINPTTVGSFTNQVEIASSDPITAVKKVSVSAEVKENIGVSCQTDDQCSTGFCRQNYCCITDCDGICMTCNLGDYRGTCHLVLDPNKECRPATCVDRNMQPKTVCGSQATCPAAPSPYSCDKYVCNTAGTDCLKTCTKTADCAPGYDCDSDNKCWKVKGQPCNSSLPPSTKQCLASLNCVQDVCCADSRSGGKCERACESCTVTGSVGDCTAVGVDNPDPRGLCPVTTPCDNTGLCTKDRGNCQKTDQRVTCAPQPVCDAGNDTMITYGNHCNGVGGCVKAIPDRFDCTPYKCDKAGAPNACFLNCNATGGGPDSSKCASNSICVNDGTGTNNFLCKLKDGQPCKADDECAHDNCSRKNKICCAEPCSGLCEKCNPLGNVCEAVLASTWSDGDCQDQTPFSCGYNGNCSGTRPSAGDPCQKYPVDETCEPQRCVTANSFKPLRKCNGYGVCTDETPITCAGNLICDYNTNACKAECATSNDCIIGYGCDTSVSPHECKVDTGTCTTVGVCPSAECMTGNCCCSTPGGNKCTNTKNDPNNCGDCALVCHDLHAASVACTNGKCTPTCVKPWAPCGNPNNGCDTDLSIQNSCDNAIYLGKKCGEESCCFLCGKGATKEPWITKEEVGSTIYRVEAERCTNACPSVMVSHKITFTVPAGVSYEICLYNDTSNCGSAPSCYTVSGGKVTFAASKSCEWFSWGSFSYNLKITHKNGQNCGKWKMDIEYNNCQC